MKNILAIVLFLGSTITYGQVAIGANSSKGELSFGIRSTASIFSASGNNLGVGAGGQFRYRIATKLNTEWFADWIRTDLDGLGQRLDAHIGESMIIYPFSNINKKGHFTPYVLGGFCADYTKIQTNLYFDDAENKYISEVEDRWSFATQLGLGTHFNITDKFDVSCSAQYILHFGTDLHVEVEEYAGGKKHLHIHQETGGSLEGHLFFTLSTNFVLFDLIK